MNKGPCLNQKSYGWALVEIEMMVVIVVAMGVVVVVGLVMWWW